MVLQLNDHFTGDDGGIKVNTLSIGLGYKF